MNYSINCSLYRQTDGSIDIFFKKKNIYLKQKSLLVFFKKHHFNQIKNIFCVDQYSFIFNIIIIINSKRKKPKKRGQKRMRNKIFLKM